MTNPFSLWTHPRRFFGSLWDWHFKDELRRRQSSTPTESDPGPVSEDCAKLLRKHAEDSLAESRELLRRSDQKRDLLTTLSSASLAAIASSWKIADRGPTVCLACSMCCLIGAVVLLLFSRRSVPFPGMAPVDTIAREMPNTDESRMTMWYALSLQKIILGLDVIADVWAAHADVAISLLAAGLAFLLPALFGY